jgi:hypothetical protein
LLALPALAPGAAWADRIDGHWCYRDGRQIGIQGPRVVTPGGRALLGDYDRHGFEYIVPDGETGAGERVTMAQRDEDTIHLWQDHATTPPDGPPQIWRRCRDKTS